MSRAADRTNKLVDAAYAIYRKDAWSSGDAAFMGRMVVLATLPHRDPGDVREFSRTNGDYTLAIQPGPRTGIPYGSYPRLVLAWLTTEAVKTKSREIALGHSLSAFMKELGLIPSGGRWGTITRFRDQVQRLFSSRIAAVYDGPGGYQLRSAEIATDVNLWWDPRHPDQAGLWDSSVILGQRFYEEITRHPVPLDMRVLREIKQSALALDLYMWLTYRLARLDSSTGPRRSLGLSWAQLHAQFGADYQEPKHFAAEAKKELKRLKVVWPELEYSTPRGRLVLHPTGPHVPKKIGG